MQSPGTLKIFLYQYITFGVYFLFWCYRLGNDLSISLKQKAVPSMWWFIVPGGAYYWMWHMSESLDTATNHRIKKTDVFLLYVVFTCAAAGFNGFYGFNYNFDSNSTSSTDVTIDKGLIVTILLIVLVLLLVIGITLHAVFMSIIQGKINKVRAGE